jgi:formylglycine-generating enzyme required for sulfatase activity
MSVLVPPSPSLDRNALIARYKANRARSAEIFGFIEAQAYADRPIPLRHPFVFYEGHLPAFSYNKLVRAALGGPSVDPVFERLFERGIDPADIAEAGRHTREQWPERADVQRFARACDAAVLDALANADLTDERASPLLERAQAAYAILEHEEMHHETLLYIVHRLAPARKRPPGVATLAETAPAATGRVTVGAGRATLGTRRDAVPFAWDNEFELHAVDVGAFAVDVNNVTNGEWLDFVRAGGPLPDFWIERDGGYFLNAAFAEIPLPRTWPVYVTQAQATAYARWRGGRLMSEPEYHRAAFGTPGGEERAFPWGDAAPDARVHGNFDFRRYDPEPVGSSPAGASAWGVHDLIGNGWEWTSTPFAPFAGFVPLPSYPEYSADFFDGAHFVVKGASPVTAAGLVRRSFRNWYRPEYPYVYATFRVAYDELIP